jgi:signal transduction histidine kinase
LGWADVLGRQTLPREKQNQALEGIVRNAKLLNNFIGDTIEVLRIGSGTLSLEVSKISIQKIARDAVAVIKATAKGRHLQIVTKISKAVPPFLADPDRLQQMLIHLLKNATECTPSGGGSILLTILQRGNQVECIVSDNGVGIDPKLLPFVFDRFRSEDKAGQGSLAGLDLFIARGIANLHGGTITAHSKGIGHGTTIAVLLPLRRKHYRK